MNEIIDINRVNDLKTIIENRRNMIEACKFIKNKILDDAPNYKNGIPFHEIYKCENYIKDLEQEINDAKKELNKILGGDNNV